MNFTEPDEIVKWYLQKKEEFNIDRDTIQPVVLGRHLLREGVKPGKHVGTYLKQLYDRQLDGEFSTLEEGLELFRRTRKEMDEWAKNL